MKAFCPVLRSTEYRRGYHIALSLGVLHYNSTPTDMKPEELGDEYDEQLKKRKLEIEADMEQYIKVSVSDDRLLGKAPYFIHSLFLSATEYVPSRTIIRP